MVSAVPKSAIKLNNKAIEEKRHNNKIVCSLNNNKSQQQLNEMIINLCWICVCVYVRVCARVCVSVAVPQK